MTAAVEFDAADVMDWLAEMRRQRWTFAYHPRREDVDLLAAYREWRDAGFADVVILISEGYAVAYRSLLLASGDPLSPEFVVWRYASQPVWSMRAAMALPAPGGAGAPVVPEAVPEEIQRLTDRFARQRATRRPS